LAECKLSAYGISKNSSKLTITSYRLSLLKIWQRTLRTTSVGGCSI
jgi:hypothetical protein